MKKKPPSWILIPLIPGMIMVIVFGEISDRKDRKIREEYTDIRYVGDIASVVKDDFFTKWGATYLLLDDNKIKVPQSFNHEIEPYNFCDFVEIGDSIKKEWGLEYVVIRRYNIDYTFKIGDYLYRKKSR